MLWDEVEEAALGELSRPESGSGSSPILAWPDLGPAGEGCVPPRAFLGCGFPPAWPKFLFLESPAPAFPDPLVPIADMTTVFLGTDPPWLTWE